MLKVGSNYIFLVVILINFILKKWKLLSAIFLKVYKHIGKQKTVIRYITDINDNLQTFSDGSHEENLNKLSWIFYTSFFL